MIVAIDGPSGTGKSTLAKALAEKFNFEHFDTGAMYRAFTWFILEKQVSLEDDKAIGRMLKAFSFDIITEKEGEKHYFVNGKDVTLYIRTREITAKVSIVAAKPFVRKSLVRIQRSFGKKKNAVFEGRDMGTVVFPRADLKIFLTASAEVRARRRYRELVKKFPDKAAELKEEEILKDVNQRDELDSTRKVSPLKKADDARILDTSELNFEEVISLAAKMVAEAMPCPKVRFSYRFVTGVTYRLLRFFYSFKVFGKKRVPKCGAVLASSHASFLDPIMVPSALREFEIHFLARSSLFKNFFFGRLISFLNTHPVGKGIADRKSFKKVKEILQKGHKLLIFPEGTRSLTGEVGKLRPGLSFMALQYKVPVVPVYIHGAYDVWGKTRKIPKLKGKLYIVFGNPIDPDKFVSFSKEEAEKYLLEKVKENLISLKNWCDSGFRDEIP